MAPLPKSQKNNSAPAQLPLEAPPAGIELGDIVVGLSGGRDSVALLYALAKSTWGPRVSALHIHHGLSPNAQSWAEFCQSLCDRWKISLTIVHVNVALAPRVSVEAQARAARYAAFHDHCGNGATMALAHHADDQVETFFIQLLRGAGPRGLASMGAYAAASTARPALWRPLLQVPREDIEAYIAAHGFAHIEDESNANTRFKRNALRADVLPALEQHFPSYRKGVLRAIAHQQTQVNAIDEATILIAQSGPLPLAHLRDVDQRAAAERFRAWMKANGLPALPATRTNEAVRQLRTISTDQRFRLELGDGQSLRVRRDCLERDETRRHRDRKAIRSPDVS